MVVAARATNLVPPGELRKRRSVIDGGKMAESTPAPEMMSNSGDETSALLLDYDEKEGKMAQAMLAVEVEDQKEPPKQPINWVFLGLLTLASFATRYFKIRSGNFVLWDEAHFGKFASYYLRRMFYFDVHPPLGKMLVALGGWLARVDGSFEFPSGTPYPEGFDYVGMRMFVAAFGTLAVPFTYLTAVQLRFGKYASLLCAAMTLFENGLIGITRLILLDSFLLGFTSATMLGYATFRNQQRSPFTLKWWAALFATGAAIGCVSSVKWVGFLVTALVGFMTIEELWVMLGDMKVPKSSFIKHFMARVLGLIVLPVSIYMLCFHIHFTILNRSGPGDANMSSLFQAGLEGSKLQKSPIDVVLGSVVTIKSNSFGGGLLHSHPHGYPSGSKQQQVTTYHHKDENNEWEIVRAHDPKPGEKTLKEEEKLEYIHHLQLVRLRHVKTGRHLHSHQIAGPVSTNDYEVSAYGQEGYYDPNDLWVVEIVADPSEAAGPKRRLKNLLTTFRLKHVPTGCYLKSRNVQLPEWGFRQGEVTCEKEATGRGSSSRTLLWNIESNKHEKLEPGTAAQYKSRFIDNFRDCNVGMYITNNSLLPDPELEPSILTSTPKDWIFMTRGIRMAGWDDDKTKFFMLGNPAVWPVSTVAILALLALLGSWIVLRHRKVYSLVPSKWAFLTYQLKYCTGGWALLYLPFFLMGRVLYLHHYYPALLFAILNAGLLFDFSTKRLSQPAQKAALAVCVTVVIGVFVYFSPMAYGIDGPSEAFYGRRWLKSWNL